jgi:hypothetical protein
MRDFVPVRGVWEDTISLFFSLTHSLALTYVRRASRAPECSRVNSTIQVIDVA